nr:hypothetical protein [Bordetella holmesii]
MRDHSGALDLCKAESQQAEAALREQLARESADRLALEARIGEHERQMQHALAARDAEVQRLRLAASSARERIDAVLARLPGAAAGEQA